MCKELTNNTKSGLVRIHIHVIQQVIDPLHLLELQLVDHGHLLIRPSHYIIIIILVHQVIVLLRGIHNHLSVSVFVLVDGIVYIYNDIAHKERSKVASSILNYVYI